MPGCCPLARAIAMPVSPIRHCLRRVYCSRRGRACRRASSRRLRSAAAAESYADHSDTSSIPAPTSRTTPQSPHPANSEVRSPPLKRGTSSPVGRGEGTGASAPRITLCCPKALRLVSTRVCSGRGFRPFYASIFMLAWCPPADMQPIPKITFYDLLSGPKGLAAGLRAFFALRFRPAWWATDHGNYFGNTFGSRPGPKGLHAAEVWQPRP